MSTTNGATPALVDPPEGGGPSPRRTLLPADDLGVVRRLREVGDLQVAAALPQPAECGRAGIDRAWPVVDPLQQLLPGGGLRRGSVVPVLGSVSLMWAVVSAASQAGAWVAVVGMPEAGGLAAGEHGVVLERLALVPEPGVDWPAVVAALVEGVDLVVVRRPPGPVPAGVGRRLAARVRRPAAVLLPTAAWDSAKTVLRAGESRWYGLTPGHGRLRFRQLTVTAHGRVGSPDHGAPGCGSRHPTAHPSPWPRPRAAGQLPWARAA